MTQCKFKDQMTPKERMRSYSLGQDIDRIPCVPMMGVTLCSYIGTTPNKYYHSAELIAELEEALFKRFRHDGVGIAIELHDIAAAMGSQLKYSEDRLCYVEKPAIGSIDEVYKLKPIDPYKDGLIPIRLKALDLVKKSLGNEVDVGTDIPAPFSTASSVIGTDNFLRALIKKPNKVHELLEVVTESTLRIIDVFCELGVDLGFSDPVASVSMISTKKYREFAMPYTKKCIQRMKEKSNNGTTLHICGRSKEIWSDMLETGMDTLSIDNVEDLEEAKKFAGDKVCISGNVDPVYVMNQGHKEDVIEATKKCIKKGYDSPNGFVLSTGCQIPINSPIENIDAMLETARTYGSYPIIPNSWE